MPKDINDLRRERQAAADRMQTAVSALEGLEEANADEGADEYVAAQNDFDDAEAAYKRADAAVKRREQSEAALSAAASGGDESNQQAAPAAAKSEADLGVGAGLIVHAMAAGRGDVDKAVARLDKDGHSGLSAALSGASDGAGGVIIPRAQSSELIQMLRARAVVRKAGARTSPMPAGELRTARQSGSATASYEGENAPIVESEPSFDAVQKDFKKLTSLVPVGNSLLRHAGAFVGQTVRDDMLGVMRLKEDISFVRADGTGNLPKGLRYWCLAPNWTAGIVATAAAAEAAVRRCVSQVEDANVPMSKPGWIMRASAKNWMAALRNPDTGFKVFPSIDNDGTLMGYPIHVTSQIPDNLGVGGDETEITFADFDEIVIGDSQVITIDVSREAAFVDVNGDTISAFQRDLTLMRAIAEHDMAPMHDEAIAGFNAVGWSL
ncbi:phage major capsid protein [Thalassovita sp.]|uniref:phage major capsid protein n=1 Tax=Thalassovita sp. TaxID=1979401 RepID=UPI002B271B7E|nr:phage major capsid protein [Thalassovita sp.]